MLELAWLLDNLTLNALVDILLVALLIFGLTLFIRGTQAVALVRGIVLLTLGMVLMSRVFELTALGWLVNLGLPLIAFAIPVVFQPELRRGLERLGQAGLLLTPRQTSESTRMKVIDNVCQAAEKLSERRHGGLIVLQRNSSLDEYIRTGILLDSEVSPQLLLTIFWPKTELHDGAAIINREGRIVSAGSVLPLSASRNLPYRNLGTRHRAAMGISEVSDALCIVVSEETGRISLTDSGRMIPRLDAKRLQTILKAIYGSDTPPPTPWGRAREQVSEFIGMLRGERKQT